MYDTADYASSRLAGTIIRLDDGTPITVDHCFNSKGIQVEYQELGGQGRAGTVPLSKCNLEPVPLGFAKGINGVAYLARMPMRRDYRQGLRLSNYISLYGVDHRHVNRRGLHDCIVGNYFNFEMAMDEAINLQTTIHFSRDWVINGSTKTPTLVYKWYPDVGDIKNSQPLLKANYTHLQESLEEAINAG